MVYVQPELPLEGQASLTRSSRCGICGRGLRNPKSIAAGIGPVCASKYGIGNAAKEERVDKHEALTDVRLTEPEIREAVVIQRLPDGGVATNVPHAVVHHSPTGYEFGYSGSGPADLALNIAEIAVAHLVPDADHTAIDTWCGTGCSYEAWIIHQDLKWRMIAPLDQSGSYHIPWDEVAEIVRDLLAKAGDRIADERQWQRDLAEMERAEVDGA